MSRLPLLFLLIFPPTLFAQVMGPSSLELLEPNEYDGLMDRMYLYNTGITRSESMGKTTVVGGNSGSYGIHNPASLNAVNSLEVQSGYMKPIDYYDSGNLSGVSLAMRLSKRIVFGTSALQIQHEEADIYDRDSKNYYTSTPTDFRFHIGGDYLILDKTRNKLDVGMGFNYASYKYYERVRYDGVHFDLGMQYRLIPDSVKLLSAGISVNNLTNQPFHYVGDLEDAKEIRRIPQILRIGIAFNYKPSNKRNRGKFRILETTLVAEVNEILNNKYFSTLKFGGELKIFEMICIRAGGYFGNWARISQTTVRKNENAFESFTCGIGLDLPLEKLISPRFPILVGLDFSAPPYGLNSIPGTLEYFIEGNDRNTILNLRICADLN